MERHPFLRFNGLADAGSTRVRSSGGMEFTLSASELALARLSDGRTAPAQRWMAAQTLKPGITFSDFKALETELGQAGLMDAGLDEPLPVPAHVGGAASSTPQGFPPSDMAGSLAAPGYPGSITGLLVTRPWLKVNPGRWLRLGAALNGTLDPRLLRNALLLTALLALLALWFNRVDAARDAAWVMAPGHLLPVLLLCSALINALAQLARAAAIQRWTGEAPVMAVHLALRFIPVIVTDTGGPAERASRAGRLRIIGAALNAMLVIFVLSVFAWFLTQRSGVALPGFCLALAAASMAILLFRANPLANREGYQLLSQHLGVPDLREQAWMSLAGVDRPWASAAPLPRRTLQRFGLGALLYVLLVIGLLVLYPGRWLETAWGGTGVLAFLSFVGYSLYEQTRPLRTDRKDIGGFSLNIKKPSRLNWYTIAAATAICMFPYTYEPSGEFVVLPKDRADVRALVHGDVREVFVQEGEQVKAGQEIARLSDHEGKAQVAASQARLQQLKADLAMGEAGARPEEIEIAKQRVATAQTRFDVADAEARRLQSAYERRAVSVQDYQRSQGQSDVQKQELTEAQRNLELVTGGTRRERIDALKAQVAAEEAQLAYFQEQLRNTSIRAPIAGRVVSGSLLFARGKYLQAGELLAVVEDTSQLSAELKVPESQAPDVAVGAGARVRIWALPGSAFDGKVVEVAPNAEDGSYGKVVRVRVLLDPANGGIRPQMTGQGKIEGRTYPAIVVFTKALARFLMIEVWSWLP